MERYAGTFLVILMAGLALGVMLRDGKTRLKAAAAVLAVFVLYAAVDSQVALAQAVYLFIMLFFFPFSLGLWFQKRFGKKS